MEQSPELTAFYNAYSDWLEAGAPEENEYGFRRSQGLCSSVKKYRYDYHTYTEMKEQFEKAGFSRTYPFGERAYDAAYADNTQHLDPNRIRWVKAHLKTRVNKKFKLV